MVNFGKRLTADQVPEWKGYYINYKLMKKKLKQYVQQNTGSGNDHLQIHKEFARMLDDQIEKTVLFLLEQQGILAARIKELGEQRAVLLEHPEIIRICELREAYRAVGQDLLKLLRFVDMNATGIRKILKKFDKRFGFSFTDYYVTTRSNHPYSQLQQVFKHVGIGAVVGALSRNLSDLQDRQGSYVSIYDQPSDALKDPIIDAINASFDRLTHSTNFLQFLGQRALIIQEDVPGSAEDQVNENYHFMSLLLNLANTFLYMVNTYIIVPTADDYSTSLGAAATVCGVIIGSMAVAQVFSSVYFSAWSNKSYFRPLVFSSIMLFLGNTFYAVAYDLNSIAVLLIGRLLCGLGSARAVNRRYISDCVPLKIRMQASAGFVSASALGMACGPGLAGLLQINFKIYSLTVNQSTSPGWIMSLAWLLYLLWLWVSFKEPVRDIEGNDVPQCSDPAQVADAELENGLVQPLLITVKENHDEDGEKECDDSEEASEDSHKAASSIASAYRLLTPSVKVQLLIYFMLKYAMEILLSESSVVTTLYFSWSTSKVAIFLAILGLTVLPVNAIVGSYISNMFEDSKNKVSVFNRLTGQDKNPAKKTRTAPREKEWRIVTSNMVEKGKKIIERNDDSESSDKESHHFTRLKSGAIPARNYKKFVKGSYDDDSDNSAITSPRSIIFTANTKTMISLCMHNITLVLFAFLVTDSKENMQILLASEIVVLVGILLGFHVTSRYSVPQYVCSALITFVAAEVLEGVNLSLLSRVMSSRLARGTFNGGLLSTEAGTLARVVADCTITLAGYLGEDRLLNVTLLPALLICVASIAATCRTYNTLY